MFNKFFKNLSHFLLMILAAGQIFRPIGLLASEVPGLPVIPSIPDAQLGADVRLTECREKFLAFTTSTKTEDIMAYLNSGCRDFSLIGPDGLPLGNGIDMMGAGSNRFPGVNLPPEFSSPVPSIPSYAPNIGAAAVAVPGFETRFTFTDQEKDAESGLLYYGARYYNPTLGRFTQPDPMLLDTKSPEFQQALLNPQMLNPYSYVSNNPLKYVDPEGMYNVKTGEIERGDSSEAICSAVNEAYGIDTNWETIAHVSFFEENFGTVKVDDLIGQYTYVGTDNTIDITSRLNSLNQSRACIANLLGEKSLALYAPNFPWDIKNSADPVLGGGQDKREYWSYIYNGQLIRYDAPGNINYGYVAHSLGLNGGVILAGARIEQIGSDLFSGKRLSFSDNSSDT